MGVINIEKTFANKQEFCYWALGFIKDDNLRNSITSVPNNNLFDYCKRTSCYIVNELDDDRIEIEGVREIDNKNEFL